MVGKANYLRHNQAIRLDGFSSIMVARQAILAMLL